jgi:hypothetical protein
VRFIANGAIADTIFGTPFGNVPRGALRDARTNTGNFTVFKNMAFGDRFTARFHMTMLNVFNHPNFASVDPFIEDAGFTKQNFGFAQPNLTNGGNRTIWFGLKLGF